MNGSPVAPTLAVRYASPGAAGMLGGGDSAAGPLTRRAAANQVSANLRAISLEYQHAELAAATNNFHSSRRLGSGCYGAVYRGELKDGSEVAIKAIDLGILMGKGECPEDAGFDEEVQMLSKFRHPHLVTLLGWGQQGLNRYLVYEFLSGGDVFQRLHKSKVATRAFMWHERISALLDSATGLSHMHNSTPKAFHRDIKSANILLDRHGTAKMADFGLSCIGQHGATNIMVKTIGGTPGYKCPIYERTGRFTEGSEVYSFGMVMMEVITGLDPSASDASVPGGIAFPIADTISPGKAGALERLLRHPDSTANWSTALFKEMAVLALRCTTCPDERQRPVFVEIVKTLRALVEKFPPNSQPPTNSQAQSPSPSGQQMLATPQQKSPLASPQHSPQQTPQQVMHNQSPSPQQRAAQSPPRNQPMQKMAPLVVGFKQQSPLRQRPSLMQPWSPQAKSHTPLQREPSSPQTPAKPAACFALDLVLCQGPGPDALARELCRLPLEPAAPGSDGKWSMAVGRHLQEQYFQAWLPDATNRACISRHALEISWQAGSDKAHLLACGTNPVSVDGTLVAKGSTATLKPGSDITFTYELKVLLRLKFVALSAERRSADVAKSWSVENTQQLTIADFERARENKILKLAGVSSVAEAVERLNWGAISCQSGYCMVYSATRAAHFLVYQGGMKEAAFSALGLVEKAPGPDSPVGVTGANSKAAFSRLSLSWTPPGEAAAGAEGAVNDEASADCRWCLLCKRAEGLTTEALNAMPKSMQYLSLKHGKTIFGRTNQQVQLEALIPDPVSRFNITRQHAEFEVKAGALSVTNLCNSVLMLIDEEPVPKDASKQLQNGQVLNFAKVTDGVLVDIIVFQVCHQQHDSTDLQPKSLAKSLAKEEDKAEVQIRAGYYPEIARSASGRIFMPADRLMAATAGARTSGQVPELPPPQLPRPAASPLRGQLDGSPGSDATPVAKFHLPPPHVDQTVLSPKAAAWSGSSQSHDEDILSPPFVLELSGGGVRDVPIEQRRLGPYRLAKKPLMVGRRYQKEFLQSCVKEDCLDFISRDHFAFDFGHETMMLLAMSQNRLWIFRDGTAPIELKKDMTSSLRMGDYIVLGTGIMSAEDSFQRLRFLMKPAE